MIAVWLSAGRALPSLTATGPTARVLALLEILQAGGTHTVAELAARREVDGRTVRRYVVHLADLEIPVRSVRGRYGAIDSARATGCRR